MIHSYHSKDNSQQTDDHGATAVNDRAHQTANPTIAGVPQSSAIVALLRLLSGLLALSCAFLPIYAYYLRPWLEWQWQPLDEWLAAQSCFIDAWCIPQFSQQPVLFAAALSILLFAWSFVQHAPLIPWIALHPQLGYRVVAWRTWLATGLFGALAVVAVGRQAYLLLVVEAEAVTPWLWTLGIFAALAAALLWDAEDLPTLQRTLANGTFALTLGATIIAAAAGFAGRGPFAWLVFLGLLLLLAAISYWSMRCRTLLQPFDHMAMLGLSLLALVLGLRYIWSWKYAFIGDEWGFLEIATVLLHRPELYQTFTTHDSNGYHTVFSSYLQAWTMLATEESLFGWRLSSLLPMIFSVPAIYAFARWLGGRSVALLSAGVVAASHMLLSFSMVPYNNTQALLPLSLGLGCFAFAIRANSRLRFLLVGMVVGLGFLVYGLGRLAAIPIGLLLLLHIWPMRSQYTIEDGSSPPRPHWIRLAFMRMVGAGLAVLFGAVAVAAPMLFNLQNWQDMMMATPAESEVADRLDPIVQMWRNVLLGAHSFLTNQKYTHYVVGPYLDPLTALLVLVGMGALLSNLWQRVRWIALFVCGWALILITSALQQYDHVSNTRMFLLIVIYALFAGVGGTALLRALIAPLGLRSERPLLMICVPLIALIVWNNQWHIAHVSQVKSHQEPIALILQQLQESAAADGGGMPVYIVAKDDMRRMDLIVHAHKIPRERAHYLESDELLASPRICGATNEPAMVLIAATHPQLAQLEQFVAECWAGNELTPIKNQVNQVIFYRFLTASGVAELDKRPEERVSSSVQPATLALRRVASMAVSEEGQLFALGAEDAKLWRLDSAGNLVDSFSLISTEPAFLTLTRKGEIVVASRDTDALLVWYSSTGEPLYQLDNEAIRLNPTGLAVDADGLLYVSDGGNGRVLRIDRRYASTEEDSVTIDTLTGNGELRNPGAIAVGINGSFWVVDRISRQLLQIDRDDSVRAVLPLAEIRDLTESALLVTHTGDLLVSDPANGRVLRLGQDGQILERWFGFYQPRAMALAGDGHLYVADPLVDQIGLLPPLQETLPAVELPNVEPENAQPDSPLSPLVTTNAAPITDSDQAAEFYTLGGGQLVQPLGIAVGPNGNLFVADADRSQVAIFAPDGALVRRITEGNGPLENPNDLVFDAAGNLQLLDAGRGQLMTFDAEGNYLGILLDNVDILGDARGIGMAGDGTIWIASTRRGRVVQVDRDGTILLEYPSTPADDGQPVDVAVDNEGRIYLVEASTLQLVQLSRLGIRRNSWTLPGFNTGHAPHLVVDEEDALYITSPEQGIITKFDDQGRVLGNWELPKPSTGAIKPVGVDIDATGTIWVVNAEPGTVVGIRPE